MPELPEVETVRGGIEKAALGKIIKEITVNRRDLRFPLSEEFEEALTGARFENFTRRGKYVIAHISGGHVMVLHLGMSGRVRIFAPDQEYTARKHDHVIFTLDDGARLVFEDPRRFGYILLRADEDWEALPPFDAMGPEPLGNEFNGDILRVKLKGRKTPIKTALLDQRIVAGLGNIYVCEALYRAGIHPARLSGKVKPAESEALTRHIRDVLKDAIKAGGSTLRDYQKTDGSLGYFQYSFGVYDREGQACPDCDCDVLKTGGVARMVQSGRSSYYCARRQK
jgi:formamidopyrimidine-DNA glycosylase